MTQEFEFHGGVCGCDDCTGAARDRYEQACEEERAREEQEAYDEAKYEESRDR